MNAPYTTIDLLGKEKKPNEVPDRGMTANTGSPRISRELQEEGFAIGRRRTARLMRENGLYARQKRRFKRTTDSHHVWPVAPNIIAQNFAATRPDEKWGADISYI